MRTHLRARPGAWLLCLAALAAPAAGRDKLAKPRPVDQYLDEADRRAAAQSWSASAGSLWFPGALLTDLGRDPKASQVDDLVTILVVERATAASKGSTTASRKSSTDHSLGTFFGRTPPWGALAKTSGSSELDGQGETTRENSLSTTVAARVVHVMPNGYLALEGSKLVTVNSESQTITVRGVARPTDISPGNLVRSDRLAQLEVQINGKGVVGDAVRRPFFLYRLLMGLLPF
jgi:flagellar L-ring protein precursor FlgH